MGKSLKNSSIASSPGPIAWFTSLLSTGLMAIIIYTGHSVLTCFSFYKTQQYISSQLSALKDPRFVLEDPKFSSLIDPSTRSAKTLISVLHLIKKDDTTKAKLLVSGPHFPRTKEKVNIEELLSQLTQNDEEQNTLKQKLVDATIAQTLPNQDTGINEIQKLNSQIEQSKLNRSNLKAQLMYQIQHILLHKVKPQISPFTVETYQNIRDITARLGLELPDLALEND